MVATVIVALMLAGCSPTATTSTGSGPRDIPISVFSEKSGLNPGLCRASHGVATATGTFTADLLANAQPGVQTPYRIGLTVYDGGGNDIGDGQIVFSSTTVGTGHWQVVSSPLASGFTPARCEVLLTVQTQFAP